LKKLNHILQWDNYFIEGFAIFFLLLGLFHFWLLVVAFLYLYWQRKVLKIPFLLIVMAIISFRYFIVETLEIPDHIDGVGQITEIKSYDYSDLVTIRIDGVLYQTFLSKDAFDYGDELYITADVMPFRKETIPFGFDQKQYMLSLNMRGSLEVTSISFIRSHTGFYTLREKLKDSIGLLESKNYVRALILGEKSFDEPERDLFQTLGILYLFTVSGIHIYGFLWMIKKVFFFLSLEENVQKILIFLLLLVFSYLNAFSMSVVRIVIIFILTEMNTRLKTDLSKLDIIHLAFMVMLIIHIQWIYHLGFLMLFLILNFIELMKDQLGSHDGYLGRLKMTGLIVLVTLPFQNQISILMILLMPLMIFILAVPMFLFSIFVLFVPELDQLFVLLIDFFEKMSFVFNDKNIIWYLPALTFEAIILYFILLIYSLKARHFYFLIKRMSLIVFVFGFFVFDVKMLDETTFYMIDVGQGDAMLIESRSCTMVIDSYQYVLPFLHDLGIYKLDYLILTHSDDDHIKEAQSLIDHMAIDHILINPYNTYPIHSDRTIKVQHDDHMTCGSLSIDFLGPLKHFDDLNNNSLVFSITLGSKRFLFTGDIGKEAEEALALTYQNALKSDVLKIAHHGSDTSTSELFLKYVNPEVALISVGSNNRFGFPDREVIRRLTALDIEIYRTDEMGTIEYRSSEKKEKWVLHLPF